MIKALPIKTSDELGRLATEDHVDELIQEMELYKTASWDRESKINRYDLRKRLAEHLLAAENRGVDEYRSNGPWRDD
jgi:hypothetical protein